MNKETRELSFGQLVVSSILNIVLLFALIIAGGMLSSLFTQCVGLSCTALSYITLPIVFFASLFTPLIFLDWHKAISWKNYIMFMVVFVLLISALASAA